MCLYYIVCILLECFIVIAWPQIYERLPRSRLNSVTRDYGCPVTMMRRPCALAVMVKYKMMQGRRLRG